MIIIFVISNYKYLQGCYGCFLTAPSCLHVWKEENPNSHILMDSILYRRFTIRGSYPNEMFELISTAETPQDSKTNIQFTDQESSNSNSTKHKQSNITHQITRKQVLIKPSDVVIVSLKTYIFSSLTFSRTNAIMVNKMHYSLNEVLLMIF